MHPSQTVEVIKILSGQSGCDVALCRRGGSYFVRKTSASLEYNSRLEQQIEKQMSLARLVAVPSIISKGLNAGLIYCDMEYVSGSDFATYCTHERFSAISDLSENLTTIVASFARTGVGSIDARKFKAKVQSVTRAIQHHQCYREHAEALDAACATIADADWSGVPSTDCHGDFTLENIIFQPSGTLVFLDMLDGELESYWLDIAKIIHDLEIGWSLRRLLWTAAPSQEARFLSMVSRYLAEELLQRFTSLFPDIALRLTPLRILQAARVLPYIKDVETFARVVNSLTRLHAR